MAQNLHQWHTLDKFGMFRGQGIDIGRRPKPWHTLALPVNILKKRGRSMSSSYWYTQMECQFYLPNWRPNGFLPKSWLKYALCHWQLWVLLWSEKSPDIFSRTSQKFSISLNKCAKNTYDWILSRVYFQPTVWDYSSLHLLPLPVVCVKKSK